MDNSKLSSELRVFISPTFRDLQEECEHLVKKIFPEIRSLCRQRGVTFTDIDLRWGLTEGDAALGRVIRICLEEVDKCRPYFIGIIGNRYGSAPEYHEVLMDPDLLAKYPWVEDVAIEGASISEMEFIHGVFDAPEIDGEHAFFYHRSDNIFDADDPERLAALIERARATGRPFREFQRVEELGRQVHDDLLRMIDRYWPESEAPSALELERRAHSAFAASRVRAYIPNPQYLKQFNDFVDFRLPISDFGLEEQAPPSIENLKSKIRNCLVVSGASGLGKSSLVAYLVEGYRKKNPSAFVIEHYVGASETSGSAASVMRHIISEIRERFSIEDALPKTQEELEKSFANWLYRAEHLSMEVGSPMLIVIDAVNQLDESSQRLAWLPKTIPLGIKLVISTTPGQLHDRLIERDWMEMQVLALEDEAVRQSIVVRYLGEFHKGISPAQVRGVITDAKASSPLYLRVVAEELRLHGDPGTLDKTIARYTDAVDLLEVFERMLERMEQDYTVSAVREMLILIEASRAGMSETELLELAGLSRMDLSQLLFAFDYHLLHRDGVLGFFHDYLRRAVKKRYLFDEAVCVQTHRRLAEYFAEGEQSERSAREQLWGYWQAGDEASVIRTLSRLDVLDLLYNGADEYEVLTHWARLRAAGHDPEAIYRESLGRNGSESSTLAGITRMATLTQVLERLGLWGIAIDVNRTIHEVAAAGGFVREAAAAEQSIGWLLSLRGENAEALVHVEHALKVYEEIGDQRGASATIGIIGTIHRTRGEYDRAMESFRRHLTFGEELDNRRSVLIAIGNIGILYSDQARYDEALESFEQQLSIAEELGDRRIASVATGHIGNIYIHRGKYDEALESFEQQLSLAEELGDQRIASTVIGTIALVHMRRREYDRALERAEQQLRIAEELGDRHLMLFAVGLIGSVYKDIGDYDRALENCARSLSIAEEIGERTSISIAIGTLGLLYKDRGEFDEAIESYTRQLSITEELGDPLGASIAIGNMGDVFTARGDYQQALQHYARALKTHRAIGFRFGLSYWLRGAARALLGLLDVGDPLPAYLSDYVTDLADASAEQWRTICLRTAREHAEECVAISSELSQTDTLFDGNVVLMRVDAAKGDIESARTRLLNMLQQTNNDAERAELHYWLWKLERTEGGGQRTEGNGIESLRLYQMLVAKTPKYDYRLRIDELESSSQF